MLFKLRTSVFDMLSRLRQKTYLQLAICKYVVLRHVNLHNFTDATEIILGPADDVDV